MKEKNLSGRQPYTSRAPPTQYNSICIFPAKGHLLLGKYTGIVWGGYRAPLFLNKLYMFGLGPHTTPRLQRSQNPEGRDPGFWG